MKLKITAFLIFLYTLANAQIKITGTVNDSAKSSVEFATVVVKRGEKVIGDALTNDKGGYSISIPGKENISLLVYYIGFNTTEIEFWISKDTIINITLSSSSEFKLNEVVITGKNLVIERKIDRLVFNVGNSIAATGGDALDALKVTPGIIVRNDVISMIGKNGLKVMINNKIVQLSGEELINFLRNIPVSNISKIEVISNPSAKYEADGNSGLVNIILKTANQDSWSSSLNSAYIKNTYSTGRGGGSFNFQKNKISLYSNLNFSDGSRQIVDQGRMYYPNQLWSNRNPRKVTTESVTGGFGIEYEILPQWKIGTQYMGGATNYIIKTNSLTTLYNNNTGSIDSTLNTISQTKQNSSDHSFNLNSTIDIDTTGKKVTFNLDYFTYKVSNEGFFYNNNYYQDETKIYNSYFAAENSSSQQTNNYSAKIDIEHPTKMLNLIYGAKASLTTTNNDISFYNSTTGTPVNDPQISNTFIYSENNLALYLSANKKLGAKWEAQVGLREEETQTKGTSETLNQVNTFSYLKFFPTAYLSFAANDNNSFLLNYGRRINRPNYEQLNPFRMYSSPYLYVEGNPFLQPSFSDNIELSHTYKNLNSKIYFSRITNGFQQLPIVEPNTNTQKIIVQNFYNTQVTGLSESFTFNKYSWWESYNSFDFYYSESYSTSTVTVKKLESFNSFLLTSNDFILNKSKTLFLNISYWYNFPGNSDLMRNSASSQFDLSLKILMLKKKLTIAVSGQDIFKTNRAVYTMYSNNVKMEFNNYYDNRCVRVSLSYRFGNNKINVSAKDFGNADEKGRTGN
jgi:hypothetical protein